MDRSRLFVLGLDGATWIVLDPLLADGQMPHLARLIGEGTRLNLQSSVPPGSLSAWTSFLTGVNPGRHGIYDFVDKRPGSYSLSYISAKSVQAATLLDIASQSGRRVVSLNVPITYPPWPINGAMVGGVLSPGVNGHFTYPPSLYREMKAAIGGYSIFVDRSGLTDHGQEGFVQQLIKTEEQRFSAAEYLIDRFDPDLFVMNNQSLDMLQHQLWHLLDPTHPRHNPDKAPAARRFFAMVDRHIGRLLARLTTADTLVVMSDHGFGPIHRRFDLSGWLVGQGYLALKTSTGVCRLLVDAAKRLDFFGLRHKLYGGRRLMRLRDALNTEFLFDWFHTQVFITSETPYALIYLNLKWRECYGQVDPGAAAENLMGELVERLLAIRDPLTGRCPVAAVHRRDILFQGAYAAQAPDLIVVPAYGYAFCTGTPPRSEGSFETAETGSTGTHREDGVAVFWGSGVRPEVSLTDYHIVDLAPFVLQRLGLPVPAEALCRPEDRDIGRFQDGSPAWVQWTQSICPPPRVFVKASPEGQAYMTEQLKKLGYR